jgi:hypothetical protein
MLNLHSDIIFLPLAFAVAIAIDWAFYERTVNVIKQFYKLDKDYNYIEMLIPRIGLTLLGAAAIYYGLRPPAYNTSMLIIGSVLFLGSNFYPYLRIYLNNRR